jgi:hypothetical protein
LVPLLERRQRRRITRRRITTRRLTRVGVGGDNRDQQARWSRLKGVLDRSPELSKQSIAAKARWADPAKRKKALAALRQPTRIAKIAASMKAQWADPEKRERRLEILKAINADPRRLTKISAASKARWADPKWRAKIIRARQEKRTEPNT